MARTESKSIQVHPSDEQAQIDLMHKFHWSLLGSQEVKTIDNHLERRGNDIYQVSNMEHYVKLTFSRDLELPGLNEIKRLEQEFFSLPYPTYPRAFSRLIAVGLFALFVAVIATGGALGSALFAGGSAENVVAAIVVVLTFVSVVGAYAAYFFYVYTPKKQAADQMMVQTNKREQELLAAVAQYG